MRPVLVAGIDVTAAGKSAERRLTSTVAIFLSLSVLMITIITAGPTSRGHGRRRNTEVSALALVDVDTPAGGAPLWLPVADATMPLSERVSEFVAARRPLLAAMDALEEAEYSGLCHGDVQAIWALCRETLRQHVASSFSVEVAAAAGHGTSLCDALASATSWESWNHLRVDLGREPKRAERATEMLVRTLLVGSSQPTRGSPEEL